MAANAAERTKTIADPCAAYESIAPLWKRSRAVCGGERFVKEFDASIDVLTFRNLLIPFSPSMSPDQYRFYRSEAEWPGITKQYAKTLVGGLLRKKPQLTLPDNVPKEAMDWIMNEFGKDGSSLFAFLDSALWEEIQCSRAWVFVDYPKIQNPDSLDREAAAAIRPYPVLHKAESVVNWRVAEDHSGNSRLVMVAIRGYKEEYDTNTFHPKQIDTIWVHELDAQGNYQVRVFQVDAPAANVPVVNGQKQVNTDTALFTEKEVIPILVNGEPLKFIPAWPLNGNYDVTEPFLMPFIDKEVALYNKMSRRNHLLYGAATYTPYICSDMEDDKFKTIVSSGLGTWFHLGKDDKAGVLEPPTESLKDMENAIASGLEELAKLGIRMLTPETAQSGVALELRNAAQTSQLGTVNAKVSIQMRQVICFMLNWRYDLELTPSDIEFSLSADFNPAPLGADWLRLVTEWYENGLIPRSLWLQICKANDIMPPEYNDDDGRDEITKDSIRDFVKQRETNPLENM